MLVTASLVAAALLSIERLTYWRAWNAPADFERFAVRHPRLFGGDPVIGLRRLFYGFKTIQIAVLIGWCMLFGATWLPLPTAPWPMLVTGVALLAFGQALNLGVIFRLKSNGMFYGNRFGRDTEWHTGFPFSLVPHPQYLGALLSVWAFMLIMRYPNPDWFALPLVSSVLYAFAVWVERE